MLLQLFFQGDDLQCLFPDVVAPFFISTLYPYFESTVRPAFFEVGDSKSKSPDVPAQLALYSKKIGMQLIHALFMSCSKRLDSLKLLTNVLESFQPLVMIDPSGRVKHGSQPDRIEYSFLDLALLKVARNLLDPVLSEVGNSLVVYGLGGFFSELLSDVCTALSNTEQLQQQRLYEYWLEVGRDLQENFDQLQNSFSLARLRNQEEVERMKKVFLVVMSTHVFLARTAKGSDIGDDEEDLFTPLEQLNILPANHSHVQVCIQTWVSQSLSLPNFSWGLLEVLLSRALEYAVSTAKELEMRASYGFGAGQSIVVTHRQRLADKCNTLLLFASQLSGTDNFVKVKANTLPLLSELASYFDK